MDKDFRLDWKIKNNSEPLTLSFTEKVNDKFFTSLLVVPPKKNKKRIYYLPREVIFIIDRSGSMAGKSIKQAKLGALSALKFLDKRDTFNIIEFDDSYSVLFNQPKLASSHHIKEAILYIQQLTADGGTEMIEPLSTALNFPKKVGAERLRQIVFLTDGSVSNESQLYRVIKDNLKDSRLFTIGIGSATNAFLMNQIAILGKGQFQQISNINETELTINNLFKKLESPVLTDIKINLPESISPEVLPNPIADLYEGKVIRAHIKTDKAPVMTDISIHGKYLEKDYLITPQFNNQKTLKKNVTGLDKMWAKTKINHYELLNLMSDDYQRHNIEIEKLGLDYQLITSQTAFIAIEEEIARDTNTESLKSKQIPNQMPHGNNMFFPETSTSSTLTTLLGLISLLIALFLIFYKKNSSFKSLF